MTLEFNWFAIAVCAVINFVVGGLWYSPLMWAKTWMRLMDIGPDHMQNVESQKRAKWGYLVSVFCSVGLAIALALAVKVFETQTWSAGLSLGFACWFGFVATTMLPNHMFGAKKEPFRLFLINAGYFAVTMSIFGIVLTVWK